MMSQVPEREIDFWGHALPGVDEARVKYRRGPDGNTEGALDALEPLEGARVLDVACGVGTTSLWLADRGADVVGFDITPSAIEKARALAQTVGTQVTFRVTSLDEMEGEAAFDRAFGNYALHHLDIRQAAHHLARLLRPTARSSFVETMATNPLLAWARQHLTGRFGIASYGTPDEHPLTYHDLRVLEEALGRLEVSVSHPTFARIFDRQVLRFRSGLLSWALGAFDDRVVGRPGWEHLSYHQILTFERHEPAA